MAKISAVALFRGKTTWSVQDGVLVGVGVIASDHPVASSLSTPTSERGDRDLAAVRARVLREVCQPDERAKQGLKWRKSLRLRFAIINSSLCRQDRIFWAANSAPTKIRQ